MNLSIRTRDDKHISDDIKTYEPRLNQEWVQILINLRMKYSKSFTRKRHSATEAWMSIYREMVQLGAPEYITIEKIKKKWMNLIARYKHLKFTTHGNNTITWPYFDQIDRAYSRNPTIIELRKSSSMVKVETDSDEEKNAEYVAVMMKKKQFTNTLIQLRFDYRHLFTGRKYAAQKGWMVIQNMHPEGRFYTIEQLSKCWQNLVQRYRTLAETERDHNKITWVHFNTIHEKMNKREDDLMDPRDIKQDMVEDDSDIKQPKKIKRESSAKRAHVKDEIAKTSSNISITTREQTKSIENETNNSSKENAAIKMEEEEIEKGDEKMLYDEENACEVVAEEKNLDGADVNMPVADNNEKRDKSEKDHILSANEIINYMVKRDAKMDEQHERVMIVLEKIADKLGNLKG